MFEIRISRTWDGRFLATMPGIGPSCASISNTLQGCVRSAQASALRLLADYIINNGDVPDAMKEWFYTVTPDGKTCIGGCKHNSIPDHKLIHPDNNKIGPRPKDTSKPKLPKHGTPEFDALFGNITGITIPGAEPSATSATTVIPIDLPK